MRHRTIPKVLLPLDIALLLLLVGIGLYVWYRNSPQPPTPESEDQQSENVEETSWSTYAAMVEDAEFRFQYPNYAQPRIMQENEQNQQSWILSSNEGIEIARIQTTTLTPDYAKSIYPYLTFDEFSNTKINGIAGTGSDTFALYIVQIPESTNYVWISFYVEHISQEDILNFLNNFEISPEAIVNE